MNSDDHGNNIENPTSTAIFDVGLTNIRGAVSVSQAESHALLRAVTCILIVVFAFVGIPMTVVYMVSCGVPWQLTAAVAALEAVVTLALPWLTGFHIQRQGKQHT